jgi:hypothetical protein
VTDNAFAFWVQGVPAPVDFPRHHMLNTEHQRLCALHIELMSLVDISDRLTSHNITLDQCQHWITSNKRRGTDPLATRNQRAMEANARIITLDELQHTLELRSNPMQKFTPHGGHATRFSWVRTPRIAEVHYPASDERSSILSSPLSVLTSPTSVSSSGSSRSVSSPSAPSGYGYPGMPSMMTTPSPLTGYGYPSLTPSPLSSHYPSYPMAAGAAGGAASTYTLPSSATALAAAASSIGTPHTHSNIIAPPIVSSSPSPPLSSPTGSDDASHPSRAHRWTADQVSCHKPSSTHWLSFSRCSASIWQLP